MNVCILHIASFTTKTLQNLAAWFQLKPIWYLGTSPKMRYTPNPLVHLIPITILQSNNLNISRFKIFFSLSSNIFKYPLVSKYPGLAARHIRHVWRHRRLPGLGRTSQRSMPGSKRSKTFSTVSPSRPAAPWGRFCTGIDMNFMMISYASFPVNHPFYKEGHTHTQLVRTVGMQAKSKTQRKWSKAYQTPHTVISCNLTNWKVPIHSAKSRQLLLLTSLWPSNTQRERERDIYIYQISIQTITKAYFSQGFV